MKLLHTADLHLDTPFSPLDPNDAEKTKTELRSAFSSLISYAKAQKIDLFLIAGDLFNNSYATPELMTFLCREFQSVPECRFVIAPGNHDCYSEQSPYAKTEFPQNVYLFREPRLSCLSFDDLGVNVWGFAWDGNRFEDRVLDGFSLPKTKSINLFCGHADITSEPSENAPIGKDQIEASGFTYMAFGHYHNSEGVKRIGETCYGYAGCPLGRGYSEPGYKGVLTAEFTSGENAEFTIKRLRFSKHRYEDETLDITGVRSEAEILARIKTFIQEQKYDKDTALRLTLVGDVLPEIPLSEDRLEQQIGTLEQFTVAVRVNYLTSESALRTDPTIRGAFFDELRDSIAAADAEKSAIAQEALRLGLEALRHTAE